MMNYLSVNIAEVCRVKGTLANFGYGVRSFNQFDLYSLILILGHNFRLYPPFAAEQLLHQPTLLEFVIF